MTGGSHIHLDKYLGVAWADRPPPQSGLSARQVLHLSCRRQIGVVFSKAKLA